MWLVRLPAAAPRGIIGWAAEVVIAATCAPRPGAVAVEGSAILSRALGGVAESHIVGRVAVKTGSPESVTAAARSPAASAVTVRSLLVLVMARSASAGLSAAARVVTTSVSLN